uniref:Uncharacterized protein n=1 Tax=Anguilla anguilla TaxID=7936 RepID=A0A0E9W7Y5_ANGAN
MTCGSHKMRILSHFYNILNTPSSIDTNTATQLFMIAFSNLCSGSPSHR